jgi:hypothetical protein
MPTHKVIVREKVLKPETLDREHSAALKETVKPSAWTRWIGSTRGRRSEHHG